jgi:hypothetical protein
MSSSEDDEEAIDMKPFRKRLQALYDLTTKTIEKLDTVKKKVEAQQLPFIHFYTHQRRLRSFAREALNRDTASLKDLVDHWIPEWKDSRLSPSGKRIRLGIEALLLGFLPEQEVDVYSLLVALNGLFKD